MATIKDAIYTRSQAVTALPALVGTRVYPTVAPKSATKPYVVFRQVFGADQAHMGGSAGNVDTRFQFDCHASTSKVAEEVARAIRDGFHGFRGSSSGVFITSCLEKDTVDDYEEPKQSGSVDEFVTRVDYDIWYTVSAPSLS